MEEKQFNVNEKKNAKGMNGNGRGKIKPSRIRVKHAIELASIVHRPHYVWVCASFIRQANEANMSSRSE